MPIFISEVGSNHNQDKNRIRELISITKLIGANAIKFQLFKAEKLYASIDSNEEAIDETKRRELPPEWIPEIAEWCDKTGLLFGCTPFDIESLEKIENHVDFIKISSFDILRYNFISACAEVCHNKGISLIISTGMATLEEIQNAYDYACSFLLPKSITILHCVSQYPAKPEQCNLLQIETLRNKLKCQIGWSDHTVNEGVIYCAIYHGATVIEFHLDSADREGHESKYGHCWYPYNIKPVIENVKIGEIASGIGNAVQPCFSEKDRLRRADPSDGLRPMKIAR